MSMYLSQFTCIGVDWSLSFTPVHSNACELRWIHIYKMHPSKLWGGGWRKPTILGRWPSWVDRESYSYVSFGLNSSWVFILALIYGIAKQHFRRPWTYDFLAAGSDTRISLRCPIWLDLSRQGRASASLLAAAASCMRPEREGGGRAQEALGRQGLQAPRSPSINRLSNLYFFLKKLWTIWWHL
jgi:hypothetical protein